MIKYPLNKINLLYSFFWFGVAWVLTSNDKMFCMFVFWYKYVIVPLQSPEQRTELPEAVPTTLHCAHVETVNRIAVRMVKKVFIVIVFVM